MKKIVTQLKNNLSEQLNLYKYMDRLTEEKKAIIVKGDVDSLSEMDKHIQAVACQLLELEQARLRMLEGKLPREDKLVDFIKKLDSDSSENLLDIRSQMVDTIRNIQKVNKLNVYLINNSIKWIEHSISTIANVIAPESAAYNSKGKALMPTNINSSGIIEHDV